MRDRPPLDAIEAAAFDGYVRDAFRVHSDGSLELVLSPDQEALLYRSGVGLNLGDELARLTSPVTLIAGDSSTNALALGSQYLLETLGSVELVSLHGHGHFGPLEASKPVAKIVLRAFATAAA